MTEVLDPAHEAMMEAAKPTKQHDWLTQLVGEWEYEATMEEPDKPPVKLRGTERVTSLAGIWVVGEGEGEMPGGGCQSMRVTLGYDPSKNRFVGTWVGSMMPMLWVYDGYLDDAERILTLESEGPSCTKVGEIGKYRDVVELVNPDYRTMTARFLDDNGVWQDMMTMHYRRKK